MVIVFGDYLDMNYTLDYGPSRRDAEAAQDAEVLRPYWEKFIKGELSLEKKRGIKDKWKNPDLGYVWIEVTNSWFGEHGYTSYCLLQPDMHSVSDFLFSERSKAGKWIDEDNKVIVTEYFDARGGWFPETFEEYIERQRKHEKKEFERITGSSFEDKRIDEILKNEAAAAVLRWENKKSARWFH